jgi:hypothetical protein
VDNFKKIELQEVPKSTCISFVNERAWLDFDNKFYVPLDRARLLELHGQCTRALEVYAGYKKENIVED